MFGSHTGASQFYLKLQLQTRCVFILFCTEVLTSHVLQNVKVFSAHGVFLQICSSPWNHLTSILFNWQVDTNQRLKSIGKLLSNKFLKSTRVCVYVCLSVSVEHIM